MAGSRLTALSESSNGALSLGLTREKKLKKEKSLNSHPSIKLKPSSEPQEEKVHTSVQGHVPRRCEKNQGYTRPYSSVLVHTGTNHRNNEKESSRKRKGRHKHNKGNREFEHVGRQLLQQ